MTRIALLFFFTLLTSFKTYKGVEISFKNDSEEDFKILQVSVDGEEFKFSNLKKGQKTKPINVKQTYWFCETTAITEKDTIMFTGFCSVGETIIKDGQLMVSYTVFPKEGESRRLVANEVIYSGSAKNVGYSKIKWEDQ
jgi:hypothetical protein